MIDRRKKTAPKAVKEEEFFLLVVLVYLVLELRLYKLRLQNLNSSNERDWCHRSRLLPQRLYALTP